LDGREIRSIRRVLVGRISTLGCKMWSAGSDLLVLTGP
jgi:hypothetical protein